MFYAKNLGNKYSQKFLDSAKKSTTDAINTTSKRAIQKTAEANGDLISNKIAEKLTKVSKELHLKKSSKELHSQNNLQKTKNKIERYISAEKSRQIIDEFRLV